MNQNIFQVEYQGTFKTVKTCNDALGAARGLIRGMEKATIKKVSDTETCFTGSFGSVTVMRLDHIPLSWI